MRKRERISVRETENDRNRERDTNRYVERVEDTLIKISRQACHDEIDKYGEERKQIENVIRMMIYIDIVDENRSK